MTGSWRRRNFKLATVLRKNNNQDRPQYIQKLCELNIEQGVASFPNLIGFSVLPIADKLFLADALKQIIDANEIVMIDYHHYGTVHDLIALASCYENHYGHDVKKFKKELNLTRLPVNDFSTLFCNGDQQSDCTMPRRRNGDPKLDCTMSQLSNVRRRTQ